VGGGAPERGVAGSATAPRAPSDSMPRQGLGIVMIRAACAERVRGWRPAPRPEAAASNGRNARRSSRRALPPMWAEAFVGDPAAGSATRSDPVAGATDSALAERKEKRKKSRAVVVDVQATRKHGADRAVRHQRESPSRGLASKGCWHSRGWHQGYLPSTGGAVAMARR